MRVAEDTTNRPGVSAMTHSSASAVDRRPSYSFQIREIAKCIDSPWYFFTRYVFTLERKLGVQRFPDWQFLEHLLDVLYRERLIVVLKSRQMLVSWTVSGFLLWDCIFRGGADHLIISRRSDEAEEMLFRVRFMLHRLPPYLQVSIGKNNRTMLEFESRHARIISLPATPDVGRSYAPGVIFWDEMAFTPYDEEIFASLQPSLDGGGKFIGVSSSNGSWTKHGQIWMKAEELEFARVQIHYSEHPYKDAAWEREARKGISEEQWAREQEMSLKEGGRLVYDRFSENKHVIDWHFDKRFAAYRSIDFGYHTPVVLWIQVTPEDAAVVCREWIGNNNTISEMIEAISAGDNALGVTEEDIACTYCDPAGAAKNDSGISSVERLTEAGIKLEYRASSVAAGIDLMREKLMDASGRIGLQVSKDCSRVISDFKRYQKQAQSGEPIKDSISDHTMDALRYFIVNYFQLSEHNFRARLGSRVVGVSRRV